jgi:hypothetical protein
LPKGFLAPGTAELIRAYLKEKKYASPYQMYKFLIAFIPTFPKRKPYVLPTYDSTRNMVYILKKLGLVTPVVAPVPPNPRLRGGFKQPHYYQAVTDKIDDPGWRDPKLAWQSAVNPTGVFRSGPQVPHRKRWSSIIPLARYEISPQLEENIFVFIQENRL